MLFALLLSLVSGVHAAEGETLYIDHTLALAYLSDCLQRDEAYEDGVLEAACFMIERLDELPDSTTMEYIDIAIRELFDLGWVVACEVFDSQFTASATASELAILTNVETGVLWIPDWPTLSGYNGWLVYLGPFEEEAWAAEAACLLLWKYPDVYAIHVGSAGGRITALPEVLEFHDILGLVPPSPGYYRIPEEPEGWEIEYYSPDVGEVEEWEQPLLITSRLPGWEIEKWVDLYIGTVELRARRILDDDQDPVEIYMRDSRFLKESACIAGAAVIEEEGVYTLLHWPAPPG